ncbi:hypothetical protein BGZ79_002422 [Entomortierella chlamydospora]|nr:hypothetical protein BGZ79_002422 [Entomortierella chlamydospora]
MATDKQFHSDQPSASTVANHPMFPHPLSGEACMRPDRIDIGDGLLLRWSTKDDEANIADLMADVFTWYQLRPIAEGEIPPRSEFVPAMVHRAFRSDCRITTVYDFALVENTRAPEGENPIIAGVSLQQDIGYFGKVKLMYGISEIIATHSDYRNKGLMRRLFHDLVHPASDLRGGVVQIIAGIPHFYRQFGYEYALDFGSYNPQKLNDLTSILPLAEHESVEKGGHGEPFLLRTPSVDDLPYLVEMSTPEKRLSQAGAGFLYDENYWRFWIRDAVANMTSKFDVSRSHWIIVDAKAGKDCGVAMARGCPMLSIEMFVLDEEHNYRDAMHSVLRQILTIANGPTAWEQKQQLEEAKRAREVKEQQGATTTNQKKIQGMTLSLDPEHPIMKLFASKSTVTTTKSKIYTRIPSYANFLLKIAPVLEDRLAQSCLKEITVIWQFNFFRKVVGSAGKGVEVVFESGKLISARDDWVEPSPKEKVMAARERIAKAKEENRPDFKPLVYQAQFAPLTFTRLVVGDMTMDQMTDIYAECGIREGGDDAKLMLDILFPKQIFHFDLHSW